MNHDMNTMDTMLIVNILIQMHGKVLDLDVTPETSRRLENVRILSMAGGFANFHSNPFLEICLSSSSNPIREAFFNSFNTTYDILKHIQFEKGGRLMENINYDKSFYVGDDLMNQLQGIYLISIQDASNMRVLYPIQKNKTYPNLLYVRNLKKIAEYFHGSLPNIERDSSPFPSQANYLLEEERIQRNQMLSNAEKTVQIENIKQTFYHKLREWQLTLYEKNEKIQTIKLSKIVEIIQDMVGRPCFINIVDYSCNTLSRYIPSSQLLLKQYSEQENDIESAFGKSNFGGKKSKRKFKKRKKKRKTRTIKMT